MNAPDFQLYSPEKKREITLSDYEGKALMITFWVSWCPDSQRDFPHKEQLYKAMETRDLDILMINVTGREGSAEAGEEYYRKEGFTVPMVLDNGTKTYDSYRCMSVPTTFLLDREHRISGSFNDKASFQDILTGIARIL
ncbi:TlpA disulfide reductase family protein [Alteribacter natronophilus]|uniref:TlpA disulfide reductase family protein n=1 Tax=Alteribacter natronophilus TaxID=2583810 RepID=UPI00110D58C0|nr:TlpA disulfide reductase family protein [Alteribacter natronophilus]TMW73543.1 TlpA family protein disulfide reductase [Alteribacter natronophilus]